MITSRINLDDVTKAAYTVRVHHIMAGSNPYSFAELDISPTRDWLGKPLAYAPGATLTIFGTPQQLWDIGMMLVKGAEAYLHVEKPPVEAAENADKQSVAQVAASTQEEAR